MQYTDGVLIWNRFSWRGNVTEAREHTKNGEEEKKTHQEIVDVKEVYSDNIYLIELKVIFSAFLTSFDLLIEGRRRRRKKKRPEMELNDFN